MADEIDYSDRVQECPECGNPNVGHSPQTDWCVSTQVAPDMGCGWLQVVNGGVDLRNRTTES
jgi:hypothetical protein